MGDEKNQTPEEKPEFEINLKPSETQKKETPPEEDNPFEAVSLDESEENLNDSLTDEETDSFYVIQRIIWGFIKTTFTIGIIVFLVWIIWDTDTKPIEDIKDSIEDIKEKPVKTEDKKIPLDPPKKTPIKKIKPENNNKNPIISAIKWNTEIETAREESSKETISDGLLWSKNAAAIFDSNIKNLLYDESKEVRTRNINNLLTRINELLTESTKTRKKLKLEMDEFNQVANKEKTKSNTNQNNFFNAVKFYKYEDLRIYLEKMIDSEQKNTNAKSEATARKIVLQKMEGFDKSLRNLKEMLNANQTAIIEDIQVVNFPIDPFDRILTPSEWRNVSNN
ncbi:MAG: hypothetical protein OEL89_01890 [Candidatus Peregrinibacteria bacterium]|nr:hypothetical protein [Candidatus Peregrinibacteria bacterium]